MFSSPWRDVRGADKLSKHTNEDVNLFAYLMAVTEATIFCFFQSGQEEIMKGEKDF